MKFSPVIFLFSVVFTFGSPAINSKATSEYIIQKQNGQIILAYKAFNDFLKSDKSWNSYKSIILEPYPSVQKVHRRQIEWGSIDTLKFPGDVGRFKSEDFEKYMTRYDQQTIHYLYDSVIAKAHKVLPPVSNKNVDLCLYLPYGGCFVVTEDSLFTICVSLLINPAEAEKIMAHEYAHVLHIERKPKESLSLKRELIQEGMAVYLTNRIIQIELENSIPFMPASSFEWCRNHEEQIKDSIKLELNDTDPRFFKRYISDGKGFSSPPKGFVEKTAYFTGYRIIERCIDIGMTLEEICSLDAETVIKRSGYFEQ